MHNFEVLSGIFHQVGLSILILLLFQDFIFNLGVAFCHYMIYLFIFI